MFCSLAILSRTLTRCGHIATRETQLRDNAAWDWVAQVTLLLEGERVFRVRCSISEITRLKTLRHAVALIVSNRE